MIPAGLILLSLVPAAAGTVRLAELARVVAASRPTPHICVDDIEALHRRLSPRAA